MISWVRTMSHYDLYLHITYKFIMNRYILCFNHNGSFRVHHTRFPIFDLTASHRLAQMPTEELRGSNNLVDFLSSALVFWIILGRPVLICSWIHSLKSPGCISGKMELMNFQLFCLWDSDQVKSSRRLKNSFYVVLHILITVLYLLFSAQRLELRQIDERRVSSLKWFVYSTLSSE